MRSLLLALAVFALLCASYLLPPTAAGWEKLEVLGTVLRFNLRGQQPLDDSIRILGITQQFISNVAQYGETYPFPRDLHAVVLRRLADAGAKVVVVDILFSEEGSWDESEDAALRDAILYCREHGCEVVLAAGVDVAAISGATVVNLVKPAPLIMEAEPWLGVSNAHQKLSYRLVDQTEFTIESEDPPRYSAQAALARSLWFSALGYDIADADNLVGGNRYKINYTCQPETFPGTAFGLEAVLPEVFESAEWQILSDQRTSLKSTAGAASSLDSIPPPPGMVDTFAETIVFYGSRNHADNDYFNTPFGLMFGVDTIAQSFDSLVRSRFLREVPFGALFVTGALLSLLAWSLSLLRPLRMVILIGAGTLLALLVTNTLLFVNLHDLPLAFTTAAFLFPFLTCTIYGGSVEEAERRKIRATFGRYMSDELVAQLVEDPQMAHLGGQKLDVAVMFVDIRSYSTVTEHLEPQWTVLMLNIFLGAMSQVIRQHGGFIDKYLGDGLLACFGGPVRTEQPARDAVAAALEMLRVLQEEVHPRLERDGLPKLRVGIGIHFGPVVMGNIGSESRMDFTVVGDSVNVAARVESCTKELGWALLVTREAAEAAPEFSFEPVGEQLVKGREQPVELFRPVSGELDEWLRL